MNVNRTRGHRRWAVALAFVALGCQSSTEPWVRRIAFIGPPSDAGSRLRMIEAPDTVRVNQPVSITVYSIGSGVVDCNRPDGTVVQRVADVTRIEPFVRRHPGSIVCTSDAKRYPHDAVVTFATPGRQTIRLVGASSFPGDPLVLDSLERWVYVVP